MIACICHEICWKLLQFCQNELLLTITENVTFYCASTLSFLLCRLCRKLSWSFLHILDRSNQDLSRARQIICDSFLLLLVDDAVNVVKLRVAYVARRPILVLFFLVLMRSVNLFLFCLGLLFPIFVALWTRRTSKFEICILHIEVKIAVKVSISDAESCCSLSLARLSCFLLQKVLLPSFCFLVNWTLRFLV